MNTIASTRRSILAAAFVSLTALGAAFTTEAAVITWGAPTGIAGDTDVSTNGTLVGALNLGPAGTSNTTVNGVLFTGLATTNAPISSGNFALTGSGSGNFSSANPPYSNLSAPYRALLLGNAGGSNATITLTISALVVGETYEFQWWSNASASVIPGPTTATAGTSVTLSARTGPDGAVGQFAIGTFIADNANQQIVFSSTVSGNTILNGFQLRQTSVAPPGTAVPEPGSALVGMLALGLCGLGSARRRRA